MTYVLNTRPVEHRARFHAAFGEVLGADWTIVDCPVLTAEPVPAQLPSAGGFDLILFTSQIAAALFPIGSAWTESKVLGEGVETAQVISAARQVSLGSAWSGKKVLAVGEATASAARAAGFTYVLDTGKDVDDMRAYLARAGFGRALYPSAEDVSADLAQEFAGRVQRIVTYRMVPRAGLDLDAVAPGWRTAPVLAPLFSRRSAETLADLLSKALPTGTGPANITAVAISAEALTPGPWTRTVIAGEPTLAGVAAACAAAANGAALSTDKTP